MARRRPSKKERRVRNAFENDLAVEDLHIDFDHEEEEVQVDIDQELAIHKKTIERLHPSEILPDKLQPRPPLLPMDIWRRFLAGEINCYQAGEEWTHHGEGDAAMRQRIDELLATGSGIEDHGQINPITGAYMTFPDRDMPVFVIESGERRFWSVVLHAVISGFEEEPELEVNLVERPSTVRQVIENIQIDEPSAICKAREIAALILERMGIEKDWSLDDPHQHFRQALNLPSGKRLPRGTWTELQKIMQLSARRMQQILSVLRMPTPLLQKADLYKVSDRVLRVILSKPEEMWESMLDATIEKQLTSDELDEMVVTGDLGEMIPRRAKGKKKSAAPAMKAYRGVRGFIRSVSAIIEPEEQEQVLGELATEIAIKKDAEKVLSLLDRLANLVRVRVNPSK